MNVDSRERDFVEFFTIQARGRRGSTRQQRSSCTFPVQIAKDLNDLIDRLNLEGLVWVGQICMLVMQAPVFDFTQECRNSICAVTACFVHEVVVIDRYTVDVRFKHDLFLLWSLTHFHLFTDVSELDVVRAAKFMDSAFARVSALLHRTTLSRKEHAA